MTEIALIAAVASNRVIGREGGLPWRLPGDLQRFRRLTMGKPIIMGRLTFESIGRPLDGRLNVVVTRDPGNLPSLEGDANAVRVSSLEDALAQVADVPEAMVIGGASLYEGSIGFAHRMYLTLLSQAFDGDVHFPEFDRREWIEIFREDRLGAEQPIPFSYVTLERRLGRV